MHADEPEKSALEQIRAAQESVTNSRHLLELSEAFWWKDVVPQIDEAVRERIGPREYERYLKDPERPALLQELRAHEIGGRSIGDSLGAITDRPLEGARSVAAVLHGRLGKERPPERGKTATWAERAPETAPGPIRETQRMLDVRQAALGRQLAERPPQWALDAWGVPPKEPGALRRDWERQAGIVGSYRETAGITDPKQAIGPVPANQAQIREAFRAAVVALRLPDEEALVRAMSRGELETRVDAYDKAAVTAPASVERELAAADREHKAHAQRAEAAREAGDAAAANSADILAEMNAAELAKLRVADAARAEWAEAHADEAAEARRAEAELRRRGLDERVRQTESEAEFQARLSWVRAEAEARMAARQEAARRPAPDIDPELVRQAEEALRTPERAAFEADMAEIRAGIERLGELVDAMPDRGAEQRAELEREILAEPGIRPPQAEAEAALGASWQAGEAGSGYEAADTEPEMEI